jgi:hypothetical protein
MTIERSRQISTILEINCRRGGYILPCVKLLAYEHPELTWDALRHKLVCMAYYGGHHIDTIRRSFEAGR